MLGVLFISVGVGATTLMYYLRGSTASPKSRGEAPPTSPDVQREDKGEYLAAWSRPADDLEQQMADIHTMANTGQSIIEPMRTRKKTFSWDDLLFKGAQLARFPLNEEEPVRTQTVIGPAARHPLVIDAPIYVSHMSFGALSRGNQDRVGDGERGGRDGDLFG